jgi:hypothetical protein
LKLNNKFIILNKVYNSRIIDKMKFSHKSILKICTLAALTMTGSDAQHLERYVVDMREIKDRPAGMGLRLTQKTVD